MIILEFVYKKFLKKEPPYYVKYPLSLIIWKPVRKFLNVVVIPSIPFNNLRIFMYRLIGFKIGKNVFIGMRCYLDDIDPKQTIIEDNVTISYGCYFACHGIKQGHTKIVLQSGVYIGMRAILISGKKGIIIGRNSIVGAGSLIKDSIPENSIAVGIPAKIIGRINKDDNE